MSALFALSGCNADNRDPQIAFVYQAYVDNGGTLTYSEWLESIKGEKGDKGDKGDTGAAGKDGSNGINGINGKDGSSLLTGEGAPSADLGKDGDSYIDTSSFDYYFKSGGAWNKQGNIKGDNGLSVSKIEKTKSEGNVDTYTITYSDGSTSSFIITNGEVGKQGKSAYEIYIENYPGYTGSEQEWIKDLALGTLSVKVSFSTNGGDTLKEQVFCKGETVLASSLPTPSKEGWAFTDWYTDASLTTTIDDSFIALNNLTLYAGYTESHHFKGELLSIATTHIDAVEKAGLYSCKYCGEQYYDSITYEDIGLPILRLDGDFTGISKENTVNITSTYEAGESSFSSDATLKWQGSSSIGYPKKNYNIKFFQSGTDYTKKNKAELLPGYGKQSKYTLKANYIDYSGARNVVSGDIWGDIVKAREEADRLKALPNGGAVDGYPILVFQNGDYQGLYTLNTPKDGWMFGMSEDGKKEALISTNTWNNSVRLREHIADDFSNGWEVEYCGTEDTEEGTSWIVKSFNEFMDFISNNDGDTLKASLSEYVDIGAAIDTLIYTTFIYAGDNSSKNMLWASYNGKKWIPSMYDMDGVFGLRWDGVFAYKATDVFFPYNGNALWSKIWSNYHDEVVARYKELRAGALSLSNISSRFSSFFEAVPDMVYEAESDKWTGVPSQKENHETQIVTWAKERAKTVDGYFGVTIDESCYGASFSVDNGGSISIYKTQDYSRRADLSLKGIARNGDTGALDASGDGQINFRVNVPTGYKIDTINIEGTYKNLKDPDDTGSENTYRITKVKSDLSVTVSLVAVE